MASEDLPASGATTIDSFLRAAAAAAPVPVPATLDQPLADDARYGDVAELARGGMGRILTARDQRLGRTVAIKELRAPNPALMRRFARETMITARLSHPSIVSVLEAGLRPSGTPWFAMKLVPGRPLDRVIADAATPAARRALLPHVLAVADAMAYAHQERVVHRDLKPHNVLVGQFGETVVIDWGLAKDLAAPDDDDDAAAAGDDDASAATRAGDVLGTPAYMPPEQAAGAAVDERADVYAIGALAYHVLAGAAPYVGDDGAAVLAQVRATPPPSLASRAPDVPAELVAIVARAMARAPADRYPSARELAADLRRYLAGQLVGAHAYSAGELLRRWVRRHRGALAVAVAALVVLAVGGALAIRGVLAGERRADAQRAGAERNRGDAEELLRFMLGDLRAKLTPVGKLEVLDAVVQKARAYYASRPIGTTPAERRTRAQIHEGLAAVIRGRGDSAGALAELRVAKDLRAGLAEASPDDRRALVALAHRFAEVHMTQGDPAAARAAVAEGLAVARPGDGLGVDDERFGLLLIDAEASMAEGQLERARTTLDDALALAEAMIRVAPDDDALRGEVIGVYQRRGQVYQRLGDLAHALADAEANLGVTEGLAARAPDDPARQRDVYGAHLQIAGVRLAQGDAPGARAAADRAHAVATALTGRDPENALWQRDLAEGELAVGDAARAGGDTGAALERYRRGEAIHARLVASDPASAAARYGLIMARNKIAETLFMRGESWAALDAHRAVRADLRALVARAPDDVVARRLLAHNLRAVAALQVGLAEANEERVPADVAPQLAEAHDLYAAIVAQAPASVALRREAAEIDRGQAELARVQGDLPTALAAYQRWQALVEQLGASQPDSVELARDVIIAQTKIGAIELQATHTAAALAALARAVERAEALAARLPANQDARMLVTATNDRLGDARVAAGDRAGARVAYQRGAASAEEAPGDPHAVAYAAEIRRKLAACCR
ncbi:MAG: serine/threonine protein kinase [Myxococcales bacterium]|nr:serine/threonine protein kinase [Myxococcales bacterium]